MKKVFCLFLALVTVFTQAAINLAPACNFLEGCIQSRCNFLEGCIQSRLN